MEKEVAKIKKLVIYPFKSAKGLFVEEANITPAGLQDAKTGVCDRHFLMVSETGKFLNGKPDQEPKLILITPSIHDNHLHLDAPGMDTLKLPLDPEAYKNNKDIDIKFYMEKTVGRDCGDEAAAWALKFFGKNHRFLYATPDLPRRQLATSGKSQFHKKARPDDKAAFQNLTPLHMMSEKSVEDLNGRLAKAVNGQCFRPNIWVEGCEAYAEDDWKKVRIGDANLTYVKKTDRCMLTTVDLETAEADPNEEPFATLKKYRVMPEIHPAKGCLGVSYFIDTLGSIKVGDPVFFLPDAA